MAGVVAQSYSEALFSLAQDENKLGVYKEHLCFVQNQLQEHPAFLRVLTHPKLHKDEKKQTLETVFKDAIDPMVLNFLKLLLDKGRFQNLTDITKEFVHRYNVENNIEVAYVRSAKALDEGEVITLQETLEKKLHKHVEMRVQVDASLIAGLRIKIGDRVLDNTAKTKVERLKDLAQAVEFVQESRGECK